MSLEKIEINLSPDPNVIPNDIGEEFDKTEEKMLPVLPVSCRID